MRLFSSFEGTVFWCQHESSLLLYVIDLSNPATAAFLLNQAIIQWTRRL